MNPSQSHTHRDRRKPIATAALVLGAFLALIAIGPVGSATATTKATSPTYVTGPSYQAATSCATSGTSVGGRWRPGPTTAPWYWQLQGEIKTDVPACVYETDGFETPKATVATLHAKDVKVICYLDVGSWEEYRPDAGQFPESVLGKRYEGYPEERWLDIAHYEKFAPIMEKRISMCAEKGFDAVEPDNINGWENKTGFPLTRAEQLTYNRWIARTVHKAGMSVALKNDSRQAKQLVGNFDFAVVEECFQYHECGDFEPFVEAGKAVFEAEYELPPKKFCSKAKALDFASVRMGVELFGEPWKPCGRLPSGD
jgi:endo-alpha-1,4-polygalactosaminidase (GH114 family)